MKPSSRAVFPYVTICLALITALLGSALTTGHARQADPVIPPTWDIISEDFESGSLVAWRNTDASSLSLLPGGGRGGSTALAVAVGQDDAYIFQSKVAKAEEGYLTFWFDPNSVALPEPSPNWWPPGTSLCIGEVRSSASDWWPPLVGFYLRHPPGQGYKGFIAWPKTDEYFYDYEDGQFDLVDGWQKITLGYRINAWVAVWLNDTLVHAYTSGVVHDDPYGDVIEVGKVNRNSSTTPSGSIRVDDVTFQIPRLDNLWVDAEHGDDANSGISSSAALRTIQRAADLAGPGSTVHIQPGVYRETAWPALNGSAAQPVTYRAEQGPGSVRIRGSQPSSSLAWTQLTANTIGLPAGVDPTRVYSADLSAWALEKPPRFIVQLDANGEVTRLPLAREPDWQVVTEWKVHEFWWAADGGSTPAACDPVTNSDHNCDLPQRSMTQLTDRTDDTQPAGIEPGNLTTLGDLTGATIVALDTLQGHYTYRRTITAHDVASGLITVNAICEHDGGTGNPGLGWGSKYYLEGKPQLLDNPGEWWYDAASKRLYLWPLTPANPATLNIEISRRENGFSLKNRSYITLDGLAVEFVEESAIYQANWNTQKSYHNTLRNALLRYANYGVYIEQSVTASDPPEYVTDGFTLEDSQVAYIDTLGIRLIDWWENGAAADSFTRSGVLNTVIQRNEMHHLGFRTDSDNAVGLSFSFANRLRFEGNHIHHVAHNGVQFSRSVIQSPKEYGFSPDEIKTGEILIKDNLFEKACQQNTDCGPLKIWGSAPNNHVFRDFLVTGNIFRDSYGWSYISEKRNRYSGGTGSVVRGMGSFGLYLDHASGVHAYRNLSYNNAYADYVLYGRWRDGEIVYWNNVAANALYGFSLGGPQYDTHGDVNTQIVNNIIVNNEGFGVIATGADKTFDNVTIDHNLYFNNGWRSSAQGGMWKAGAMVVQTSSPSSWLPYPTLADVQANTDFEDHGVEGDAAFYRYDPADHDLFDGSWPDFHLTPASTNAIDRGAAVLPASLVALLDKFGIDDPPPRPPHNELWGGKGGAGAYDIGRYEAGFTLQTSPPSQAIAPGGTAQSILSLSPSDLPYAVTLSAPSPSPGLTVTLSAPSISAAQAITLSVTHDGLTGIGRWFTIPISGTGGGFTQGAQFSVLVSGERIYLPVVVR